MNKIEAAEPRAVEISSTVRIGVYDCLYVALAEREHCDLVTADEKLIKNHPGYPIVLLSTLFAVLRPDQVLPQRTNDAASTGGDDVSSITE